MTKRFVSMMLALSMMLSLVPASAFADTGGGASSTPARTQELEEENSEVTYIYLGWNGKPESSWSNRGWTYNKTDDTLTLTSGSFELQGNDYYGGRALTSTLRIQAGATLLGGTVDSSVDNAGTISGGTFNGAVGCSGGAVIDGGTFKGLVDICYYYGSEDMTIKAGTFNGGVSVTSGALTINGGTFGTITDNSSGIGNQGISLALQANGSRTLTINGGTFNGKISSYAANSYGELTLTINSGVFHGALDFTGFTNVDRTIRGGVYDDSSYLAPGYDVPSGYSIYFLENSTSASLIKITASGTKVRVPIAVDETGAVTDWSTDAFENVYTVSNSDVQLQPTVKICKISANSADVPYTTTGNVVAFNTGVADITINGTTISALVIASNGYPEGTDGGIYEAYGEGWSFQPNYKEPEFHSETPTLVIDQNGTLDFNTIENHAAAVNFGIANSGTLSGTLNSTKYVYNTSTGTIKDADLTSTYRLYNNGLIEDSQLTFDYIGNGWSSTEGPNTIRNSTLDVTGWILANMAYYHGVLDGCYNSAGYTGTAYISNGGIVKNAKDTLVLPVNNAKGYDYEGTIDGGTYTTVYNKGTITGNPTIHTLVAKDTADLNGADKYYTIEYTALESTPSYRKHIYAVNGLSGGLYDAKVKTIYVATDADSIRIATNDPIKSVNGKAFTGKSVYGYDLNESYSSDIDLSSYPAGSTIKLNSNEDSIEVSQELTASDFTVTFNGAKLGDPDNIPSAGFYSYTTAATVSSDACTDIQWHYELHTSNGWVKADALDTTGDYRVVIDSVTPKDGYAWNADKLDADTWTFTLAPESFNAADFDVKFVENDQPANGATQVADGTHYAVYPALKSGSNLPEAILNGRVINYFDHETHEVIKSEYWENTSATFVSKAGTYDYTIKIRDYPPDGTNILYKGGELTGTFTLTPQAHDTFDANDFIVTGAPEAGAELEHTGHSVVDISAEKKADVTKNYGEVHVWYYDAKGNAIPKPDGVGSYTYKITVDSTGTCDGGTIQEGSFFIKYKPYAGSLTLASSSAEYDGTPKAAVPIATDDAIGKITVKGYYQQVNGEFDRTHLLTTITEGGTYLPVIDFAGSDTYLKLQDVTSEGWMFVITPRTLDGSEFTMTPPDNLKADGSAKEATVTVNAPYQLGKILSIRYYNETGACDPVKPGTYTVQISVAASNNNQSAFGLTVGTFTIEEADEKTATLTVNGKSETRTVGKNVTVTAEDRDGEVFTGWTVEGITLTAAEKAEKTISFTMPENDVTLTANYKKVEKTATLTVNGKSETRTVGKNVTVTAEDRDGEIFTGWTVEGITLTEAEKAEKTISFTMPENDVTLTANYKKTEIPEPTPDPEPDPTYKLTVIGADLTLEEGTDPAAVKVGQLVTVKAWADTSTDRFAEWIITDAEGRELTPADLLGEDNEPLAADAFRQKELCFKMPSFGLNISVRTTPVTPDDPSSDGGSSKLAAIVETGAWLTGGALISYEVITTRYLVHALPEGTAIPTTRAQLALMLWQNAGKPEPATPAVYMDVADADTAKAARWAVEEGLVSDKDDSTFTPDRFVTKLQVIRAWNKLKKLNKAQ